MVLDIASLAENPDNQQVLDDYAFNGTIEVTFDSQGYRDFKAQLMRIEGGKGYRIPSRNLADDKPYPVCVSFDEWDVLYTSDLTVEDDVPSSDKVLRTGIRYFGLSHQATADGRCKRCSHHGRPGRCGYRSDRGGR